MAKKIVKRTGTSVDAIIDQLKKVGHGVELTANTLYAGAAAKGFANQNTIRGRLSELTTMGIITRRKGWTNVYYGLPTTPTYGATLAGAGGQ